MKFILTSLFMLAFIHMATAQASEQEDIIDVDFEASQWNSEGYQYMMEGKYALAKDQFWKAITKDPKVIIYYENLANACSRSDDQEGLLKCYTHAKQNLPDEPDIFYYSGDVLQNAGQYANAIADYNKAIVLAKNKQTELLHLYYFNRGNSWLKLRDYQNAKNDYDQALHLHPLHKASYANRAMAHYNLKNKEGACADWQKAYELGYTTAAQYQKKFCR